MKNQSQQGSIIKLKNMDDLKTVAFALEEEKTKIWFEVERNQDGSIPKIYLHIEPIEVISVNDIPHITGGI